ncbi:M48 family metallopeptidase [Trichloromonas sp.]|uniref:M48 family metallopeptidase n=1 Tax=Trichloromonas sp. TaxID=3069249 RepID=UPI002A49DF8D|nr:SprT family zinc-dependent metalloprotease [Trichloromonas sp.]
MTEKFTLGDMEVEVTFKDIKNVHLSVYPPEGKVKISAPARMDLDTVRVFAIGKLAWIKSRQKKLREQERETPRELLDRESHYVWGERYLLQVIERDTMPRVELTPGKMLLYVRSGTSVEKRREILDEWYREQLKIAVPPLLAKWEPLMGVKVKRFFVRRMKTRWGSCNPETGGIRLNSELAKKPPECLEYLVVHEMTHLLEPTHNDRFMVLLERFIPRWKFYKEELNRLPVRHEEWGY